MGSETILPEWAISTPWWVVVGLTVTIGYAIIRFTRWTSRVDTRLDTLTDMIQKGLDEVREDIKRILERQGPRDTVEARSPIQLTEFGREISSTSSVNNWARTHAPSLQANVAGKEEFEVFDICVSYVDGLFETDADFQRTVKATAYQHGTEAGNVLKVYQVELRDVLLQDDPSPS